ncbi:MAG: DUF2752 domain-containing protein [Acidimicrobiales bacterium]|nr:DUF2752 domain-containing protein [Acidimicrobiales bacterium]
MLFRLQRIDPTAAAGIGFAATALVMGASAAGDLPVLCLFRRCTGGYCPGCGGSRAAVALVQGDIAGSWAHHPWVVLLVLQTLVFTGALFAGKVQFTGRIRQRLLIGNLGLGLAIWTLRLALGTIPIPFA